jgi:hypothetical protein
VREFRRSGQRIGLTGTVIAFGIAALITLGAGAASSQASGATQVIRLRGHDVKALAPFRVAAPSTLFWTNSGSFFQISSNGGYCNNGAVTSKEHRGTTYISPGRYYQLGVTAIGIGRSRFAQASRASGSQSGSALGRKVTSALRTSECQDDALGQHRQPLSDLFFRPGDQRDRQLRGPGGTTRLPPGRYRLYVNAAPPDGPMGSWKIVIR